MYIYAHFYVCVCFPFKIEIPMDQGYPEKLKSGLEYR